MNKLAVIVLLLLAAPLSVSRTCFVIAQDEAPKSKATERRPINDQMTLDEAGRAIDAAAKGDEEALQKLKDGRLAYLPALLADDRAENLAYSLMRDDIDWVRDMQAWELVLQGISVEAMESTFADLKDRFVNADSQLSRAVIKAHQLGDFEAARRLAALSPKAAYVLAAQAWTGEVTDPARRVNLLLAVLDPKVDMSRWNLTISPGMLDDAVRRNSYGTNAYAKAEIPLFTQQDGVSELLSEPVEWIYGQPYEKLGILTHDLPRADRDAVAKQVADSIGNKTGLRYMSFAYGAFFGEKSSEFECNFAFMRNARSAIAMCYARTALKDQDLARRFAAIAVYWGAPDWKPAQEFMLDEAFASGDDRFARIAIRAVLGANDDCLRAANSVALALRKGPGLADERKAFVAALKATKNAKLAQVAAELEGKGAFPADAGSPLLKLTQAQKAALLQPFMHADEVASYGGIEPAYLMNLSQFYFAQHRVIAGVRAAAQSIELAAKTNKRRLGLANAAITHRTLRNFLGNRDVRDWLQSWKKQFPVAVEILEKNVTAYEDPTDDVESAAYALERQSTGGDDATDEQRRALGEDYSIAGGHGLNLLGFTATEGSEAQAMYQAAERVSPTDYHIYFQLMPYGNWFGRYSGRDWTVAEHMTQCLCVLQPYNWSAICKVGGLMAKAGCDPRGMTPLVTQAIERPTHPYLSGVAVRGLEKMLFARSSIANLLRKNGTLYGDRIESAWEAAYTSALEKMCWGLDWWDSMCWGPQLSNRRGFARACFDNEYNARDMKNVSILLDYALELQGVAPDTAIKLVAECERIGVSDYGYFVGSQSYVRAKAHLGEFDAAFKRWEELRGGEVGYPPYLDSALLHGMAEGNQHKHLKKALEAINKYDQDFGGSYYPIALRRAFMANGEHAKVGKVNVPKWSSNAGDTYNLGNYTEVFFEARRLFETGGLAELTTRARTLFTSGVEVEIGVLLDAFLLRCLAGKLQPDTAGSFSPDAKGMLHGIKESDLFWFGRSSTLDYMVLEILAGHRKSTDLPEISKAVTWHGLRYSERPQGFKGSGFLSEGEAEARDSFVRGVLAFLVDDDKTARKEMQACVKADQRFSYEYHVAEWLLDKQIPKK